MYEVTDRNFIQTPEWAMIFSRSLTDAEWHVIGSLSFDSMWDEKMGCWSSVRVWQAIRSSLGDSDLRMEMRWSRETGIKYNHNPVVMTLVASTEKTMDIWMSLLRVGWYSLFKDEHDGPWIRVEPNLRGSRPNWTPSSRVRVLVGHDATDEQLRMVDFLSQVWGSQCVVDRETMLGRHERSRVLSDFA